MHEKQKPLDNEAFEPTIPVFLPLSPLLALLSSFLPSPPTERNPQRQWGSLVPTKTDISVVGTIVRGLTIDPEKEISSSHEARRPPFYFSTPSPLVFRYPPTLFPSPLLLTQPSYLQRQITPFATVISLRLCSFADTPVSLFYSKGFVRIFLPLSSSLSYARHVFPSSRNLFVSRPSLPSSSSPVCTRTYIYVYMYMHVCTRVFLSYHPRQSYSFPSLARGQKRSLCRERSDPDIPPPLRRPKLNDLSYKRLSKPIHSEHGTIDKSAEQQPSQSPDRARADLILENSGGKR